MKYAFCLIHFDNKKKYLEYEIYTILMLKNNTKNDILYLYSINDTPEEYIKIIKSLDVKTIPYDDNNITYKVKDFKSYYTHFNTLRTCNYIFAFNLTEYDKICYVESDMVFMKNLDSIFELNCPAILYYHVKKEDINKNIKLDLKESKEEILNKSIDKSFVNGGVLLFKPSKYYYKKLIKNLEIIIKKNCIYPNESLFLYSLKNLYNLPIMYNLSHYYIEQYNYLKNEIYIYHFNSSIYKVLNVIKDDYIEKNKRKKYNKPIFLYFKEKYYDPYYKQINNILNHI